MIKFLKQIRKTLIMENNTFKYFKYALGEIFLVVIGILIALQINNWNQDRINKDYELKMLRELVEDLKLDTTFMNVQFKRIERFEESVNLVLNDPQNLKEKGNLFLFGGVYFI